jgi:hypothetical protein
MADRFACVARRVRNPVVEERGSPPERTCARVSPLLGPVAEHRERQPVFGFALYPERAPTLSREVSSISAARRGYSLSLWEVQSESQVKTVGLLETFQRFQFPKANGSAFLNLIPSLAACAATVEPALEDNTRGNRVDRALLARASAGQLLEPFLGLETGQALVEEIDRQAARFT